MVRYGEGTYECPLVEFGRVVSNRDELDAIIQSGVSWVTVDTDRSEFAPRMFDREYDEAIPLMTGLATFPHTPYGDEILVAQAAYSRGLQTMNGLLESIRDGLPPDIASVKLAAGEIAGSAGRNYHASTSLPVMRSQGHIANHSVNVAILAASFAVFLGSPPEAAGRLALAGMLHDVGKMRVDPQLLNKPGRLTAEEFRAVKKHTLEGYVLLRERDDIPVDVLAAVLDHHERPDGKGYPRGRRGGEVGRDARVLALADVYDALISDRPYRKGMTSDAVLGLMHRNVGTQFDKDLFTAFVCFVGLYPVGSLVRLWDGTHGVVCAINHKAPHRPVVRVCYDEHFRAIIPEEVDLSEHGHAGGVDCCICPVKHKVDVESLMML